MRFLRRDTVACQKIVKKLDSALEVMKKLTPLEEKLRNRGYHVDDGHNGPLLTILPK